ncbi:MULTISPECIES: hypothetical protein [Stenotrophomonas]|jgi:dolichol kinase|uniref:hypothetical protein n=1 Tax=Stenotrophomonas sp. CFBP8994 TaxID=3096527 RepID=UPI002A6A37F3|nr:hypothetical protein [Stenotrophomonas sp. CFBP8994]MDY0978718.1 hypothetical protein [Stenotrophomonas sp. CFBP8994]
MNVSEQLALVAVWRVAPVVLIGTFVVGNVAWVFRRRGLRDGFSRKINHFGLSALSALCLFGLPDERFVPTAIATSLCVVAVYAWSSVSSLPLVSNILASNVRDRDGVRGNLFVFLPLLTGQFATYAALALVSPLYAKVAFCAMGLGDGLAEPVGMRFGRRKYAVYDPIWRVRNTKSFEGSSAVLLVSFVCCVVALVSTGLYQPAVWLLVSLLFALSMTVVEAVAPRGMDNMLIVGSGAALLQFMLG